MKYRIIDLETQNHDYYGAVASLHNPLNYIVEAGWLDVVAGQPVDYSAVQWHRSNNLEESQDTSWFSLDGVDVLVAHNAAYEIKCFLSRHRAEFEKFLKRGGRVLCTQYAEYLLSDFQHLYPALDEVAPDYGGTHKVDGIKLLWEQGVLTSDIDPEMLHHYLCSDEGDVVNTTKVFLGQMQKLIERQQWVLFLQRCECLLAFAYCEWFGLKIDTAVAQKNMQELAATIAERTTELDKLLPADLPPEYEFSWGSRWDVSALLFGGARPYKKRVPYDPPKFEKADYWKVGADLVLITDPDAPAPAGAEVYKAGKNKGLPKVFREDTDVPKLKWEEFTYNFKAVVPIPELPTALRENFEPRGEWRGAQEQRDGTPVYSTNDEVCTALAVHGFSAAKLLTEINKANKDLGTFYMKEELNPDGTVKKVSGALQYVTDQGFIHHNLNLTSTVTGRPSSTRPNLQNLPRADEDADGNAKSRVKEMFVSRFTGGYIVQVDYSALEVVMLAGLTGDTDLLQHLLNGTDMHCFRLAAKLGEPYTEVKLKCKDPTHPEHGRYSKLRTEIKAPSFAAQYGASATGIAFATGCSVEYAQEFLDNEAKLFPQSIGYRQVVRSEVERTGALPGNMHREQAPDGTWKLYRRGYFETPGHTRYSFRQFEQWNRETRSHIMDYKPTQLANYWCQGEAFYLMAVSAGRVIRWLLQKDFFGGKVCLINNVHDALYLDVHPDHLEEAARSVQAIMEDAPKYMAKYLGYDCLADVPFPAEPVFGHNMLEENKLPK